MGVDSIQWGDGAVALGRGRLTRPFEAAGWFSRFGVEEHVQPGDGALVVFALPAHVADPCREIGNGDQFFVEPREVRDVTQVHYARAALIAWNAIRLYQRLGLGWRLVIHG